MSDWYGLHVRSNCEKLVSEALSRKGIEAFFPSFRPKPDREKPYFPGYVFCRFTPPVEFVPVIRTPHVIRVLGDHRGPISIPVSEIESVRMLSTVPLQVQRCPYLAVGDEVMIHCGPLAGAHGRLIRFRGAYRVICSVHLLQQSVIADLDVTWLERRAS